MDELVDGSYCHSMLSYTTNTMNDISNNYISSSLIESYNCYYDDDNNYTSSLTESSFDNDYKSKEKPEEIETISSNNEEHSNPVNRNNLIIWDWDDTLFPTYSFRTQANEKDKQFIEKLNILVSIIKQIFTKMIKIYGAENIIIVTNGSSSWIYKCLNVDVCQDAFMSFQKLLKTHKILTISASTKEIRNKYPKNHYKWKEVVFTKYFKKYFNNNIGDINCITSIGDSLCEYKASDISSKYIKNRILNRIKLKSKPSINEIIFELKQINKIVDAFGITQNDIEIDFDSTKWSSHSTSDTWSNSSSHSTSDTC